MPIAQGRSCTTHTPFGRSNFNERPAKRYKVGLKAHDRGTFGTGERRGGNIPIPIPFVAPKPLLRMRTFLICCTLVTLLTACKKDAADVPAPAPAPLNLGAVEQYSNLDSGNYWIYQKYKVDSTDAILETLAEDSIWVDGDTLLSGVTYAVVRRAVPGGVNSVPRFWRDSLSYLITSTHETLFCTNPLDQVIFSLYQGPVGVVLDYSVFSTPVSVTVPAGTMDTHMMRCEITSIGGYPQQPEWKRLRSYWAPTVGRVRYYEFFGANNMYGHRYDLVRYQVQ